MGVKLPMEMADKRELKAPNNQDILVSEAGLLRAFKKVGMVQATLAMAVAPILYIGEEDATQRTMPITLTQRQSKSVRVRPPIPLGMEIIKITVVMRAAAPKRQRELVAPLASWLAKVIRLRRAATPQVMRWGWVNPFRLLIT